MGGRDPQQDDFDSAGRPLRQKSGWRISAIVGLKSKTKIEKDLPSQETAAIPLVKTFVAKGRRPREAGGAGGRSWALAAA